MRYDLRFAGQGGQGIILTAVLLAAAAVEYDGLNAIQTQSYGPESRGGASRAEVIVSDDEIIYPEVLIPDVVLVMSQPACDNYARRVKPGGIVVANSSFVKDLPPVNARVHAIPITEIAVTHTSKTITSNMVALGVIAAITGVVSVEALERVTKDRTPRSHTEENLSALSAGYDVGCGIVLPGVSVSVPLYQGERGIPSPV